ncbi:MAG: VOC family protein [Rhizomicrobium sp.]|nr:VOC family protein [Rhizomicrobium sp.]
MSRITPFLWFDREAEEAAKYYISIFPHSKMVQVTYYGEDMPQPAGSVMTAVFELDGQIFIALNGGPNHPFTHAVSFVVNCETQAELDSYWQKLSAGGKEVACGWLTDKYGLSWQITPATIGKLLDASHPAKSQAVMQAMMGMVKLDMAALDKAYAEG